jgi:hypothetical protein
MWNWWRSSQGYCTLCAFAAMAAFVYMAFAVQPLPCPPPSKDQQNRPVTPTNEHANSSSNQNNPPESFWRRTMNDPVARFTFWLFVATGTLATVAAVQAGLFLWQLRLMREGINDSKTAANAAETAAKTAQRSAEISQQRLIASNRAWVKAEIEMSDQPCIFDSNSISVAFRFKLQNIGNAPALNISTHAWLVPFSSGSAPTEELRTGDGSFPVQIQRCEEVRNRPFEVAAFTLFPQGHFPDIDPTVRGHYRVGLAKSEIPIGLFGPHN